MVVTNNMHVPIRLSKGLLFLPSSKGLSWFAVDVTSGLPSLFTTSHAQPEPKRVAAAAEKLSTKHHNHQDQRR